MSTKFLLIVLTIIGFTAIACSGTMKGIDRYTGKRVYLDYEDQKFGSARIRMTMPDGEHFTGKVVENPATPYASEGYPELDEFPGNTEAFLYGDRGSEMRCKFRLSDTVLGFRGGGFGLCEASDGRVIDIFLR